MTKKYFFLLFLFFSPRTFALEFTGRVDLDFPETSCLEDENGQNIPLPATFPEGSSSGFDVRQICLLVDFLEDTLYAGILTFEDASGNPVIFGDADGDGDPSGTSVPLEAEGGEDFPSLSEEEYFVLILDFDNNLSTLPDVAAGISAERSAPSGYRVAEVAEPDLGIDFAFSSSYYGSSITPSSSSRMGADPSEDEPHLEFTITGFSSLPGISSVDLDNPDETILFVFKSGSLGDTVIGEEEMEFTIRLSDLLDSDGDGSPNSSDSDQDNDGISDIVEQGLDEFDADGDGQLSGEEVENSGLDSDGDGDIDTNDENFSPPDTDSDGAPDYLDTDSDNDSILDEDETGEEGLIDSDSDGTPDYQDADSDGDGSSDAEEAGDADPETEPEDSDGDGINDFQDLDADNDGLNDDVETEIGTDPQNPDSDGDGVSDGDEMEQGLDPLTPGSGVDPDIDVINSDEEVQVQGSGLGGCSLNVEQFRPNFDNLGTINLLSSKVLAKRGWSAGSSLSYSQNPLELGAVGGGARLDSLVDYHVNMNLTGAYGINDWIDAGIIIPFFPNLKVEPLGTQNSQSGSAFGDLGFAGKFGIWDKEGDSVNAGFSLSPFIFFPTGSGEKFTGDDNLTGGFQAILDADYKKNYFVTNLGFRFREKEELLNISIGQEFLYGVGYGRPIWEPWDLHGITELKGSVALNGFGSQENRSPLEWLFGIKKGFRESRLNLTTGASLGLTTGYGSPDFRVFSMVGFLADPIPLKKKQAAPSPPLLSESPARLVGEKIVILEPIHFETAQWTIISESFPVIKAVADLMVTEPQVGHVVVKGHTDATASEEYNRQLSQKRAESVVEKLISYGVSPERLSAEGWGESQPVADNSTDEGKTKNRRVEFYIVEIKQRE